MLLDNDKRTVCWWIEKYTENGEMDVVIGYFTIGALAYFSEKTKEKISRYQFILGDPADSVTVSGLDLLKAEIGIEAALKLKKLSQDAVNFLKQENVNFKTLEPNFCHAKLFLHSTKDERHNYYITGSSNLTESGIGLKPISNAELNIADHGDDHQYKELKQWFSNIWNNRALRDKTIKDANGKSRKINFKEYLIAEISKIFEQYTPNDIYLKILAEMGLETNTDVEKVLKKSHAYNALYDFQKAGAISLITMLDNHNGAILADAVGLGKTWTALSVIKYYQDKGFQTIVICPKKLKNNWNKWKKNFDSRFKQDNFEYFIRFHTDLDEKLMKKKGRDELSDVLFTSEWPPKLFVIDESHNLRNDKSKRYNFLLESILKKNKNAKVLMLSATPINNSIIDIRNQFKLIPQIQDIDSIFRNAQKKLNDWAKNDVPKIADLMRNLPHGFLDTTDKYIVARTRAVIEQKGISFPKWQKPQNYYITPNCIKDCDSTDKIQDMLPARFSAYMPAFYAEIRSDKAIKDESQRDVFLVKMMQFLLLKRLESSWFSFRKTVNSILEYHKTVLEKVSSYQDFEIGGFNEDDLDDMGDDAEDLRTDFELGKKRKIQIRDIINIDGFKKDVAEDVATLQSLLDKLNAFNEEEDDKLLKLLDVLAGKPKTLIFTTYTDTAQYLYKHISKKIDGTALVTGDTNLEDIDKILHRFAPVARFKESERTAECERKRDVALKDPINILITTDVLSEGQNLQDCDFVINYDIHWNPVRAIQRMGRIDRLGSDHKKIYCANFWPAKGINEYLNLQRRVETRMTTMKIAGAEIPHEFTERLNSMSKDKELEQKQIEKNLKLMQEENIEEFENKNFGLNNLGYETFRQDLTLTSIDKYKSMPDGIFSGFLERENGLIALLKQKHKKDDALRLIFIDAQGHTILSDKIEVLSFLRENRLKERFVPREIEECDEAAIKKWSSALNQWFTNTAPQAELDQINGVLAGTIQPVSLFDHPGDKYQPEKWVLLCWCLVSKEK
jgi:superfamily II DNA or RNA helicase